MDYPPRACTTCGSEFTPRRSDQKHCPGGKCNTAGKNLAASRGKLAYRILYHHRKVAGRKGKVPPGCGLGDLTMLVDEWLRADRKAGRPAPPLPNRDR